MLPLFTEDVLVIGLVVAWAPPPNILKRAHFMEGQNSFFFYIVENKIQLYIYVFELNKATYYLK